MQNGQRHNVFTGKDSLQQLSRFLSSESFSQIFVLTDEHTFNYCFPELPPLLAAGVIEIKSGEEHKTIQACEVIWNKLTEANVDRNALLINLGGGMVTDVGGFAAGCFKRGIKFVNVPTTLLAMVDASVGGKTGVDFKGFKNQVGLFCEPQGVYIHTGFLKTLPERELVSGFAEVIKHYLIADGEAFTKIRKFKTGIRDLDWEEIVRTNVSIKSQFVAKDPYEKNIRKALNFGHTIGHAVESYFLNSGTIKLLHGEAVAVGMICESCISKQMNFISQAELESITEVTLHYFNLPLLPEPDFDRILAATKQDKKNASGKVQYTLLSNIGSYNINNSVEDALVTESLKYYNTLLR